MRKQIPLSWQSEWTKKMPREEEGRKAIGLGRFYQTSARISIPIFKSKAFYLNRFSRGTRCEGLKANYESNVGSDTNIVSFA